MEQDIADALVTILEDPDIREEFQNGLEYDLQQATEEYGPDYYDDAVDDQPKLKSVSNFRQAGVMSLNKGVVLRFTDGSQFHLSVVRSK